LRSSRHAHVPTPQLGAAAQRACCPYNAGGTFSGVATGVVDAQNGTQKYTTYIGLDATTHRFAILFGSDVPADAAAGYNFHTSSNGVQTLSFWYNNTGVSTVCGSTPMTGNVIPMSFCAGSGIFSEFLSEESPAPEFNVSVWAQAGAVPAHAHYTSKSCAPVSVVSPMNPFGGGAMALVMKSSSGVAPPAALFDLPPACAL
jgi:hypothetical protein